jgi:uncharacterized protein
MAGGFIYTIILPTIQSFLGPDLGTYSLFSIAGHYKILFFLLDIMTGAAFIWTGFWLNKKDKSSNYKWFYAGVALAVLNSVLLLSSFANRPIGASSAYPYIADLFTGTTQNNYFAKIQEPGQWEVLLLTGAFISGIVISILRKEFKLTIIHRNWERYKGKSVSKRLIWSFLGGFILIFVARMAGGCKSGHVFSGGMQLSVSSLSLAAFVFAVY